MPRSYTSRTGEGKRNFPLDEAYGLDRGRDASVW
jgi:hypothetical protein